MNPEGDRRGRRNRPTGTQPPANDGSAPGTPTTAEGSSPDTVPDSPWGNFPMDDKYPRVPDPSVADREVSTKQANRPFLACVSYLRPRQEGTDALLLQVRRVPQEEAGGA